MSSLRPCWAVGASLSHPSSSLWVGTRWEPNPPPDALLWRLVTCSGLPICRRFRVGTRMLKSWGVCLLRSRPLVRIQLGALYRIACKSGIASCRASPMSSPRYEVSARATAGGHRRRPVADARYGYADLVGDGMPFSTVSVNATAMSTAVDAAIPAISVSCAVATARIARAANLPGVTVGHVRAPRGETGAARVGTVPVRQTRGS
jgi:hypothetical protein